MQHFDDRSAAVEAASNADQPSFYDLQMQKDIHIFEQGSVLQATPDEDLVQAKATVLRQGPGKPSPGKLARGS